jgi:hypothetical protein
MHTPPHANAGLKIDDYRRHRCTGTHTSARDLLVCAITALTRDEVHGDGSYALIHESRIYRQTRHGEKFTAYYRVNLYPTEAALAAAYAEQQRAHARTGKCSAKCHGMPRAVRVVLPGGA